MLLRLAALTALVLAPSQAMAEWHEAKTNHFIIYSQQKPRRASRIMRRSWSASTAACAPSG